MTSTALTTRDQLMPSREDFEVMMEVGAQFLKSGLLPRNITTVAATVLIIQKGIELGLPPTYALSNVNVIGGKPVASSELMLSLIYRDHGDDAIQFAETSAERCTISYKRRSATGRTLFTFSLDDAKKAQLLTNPTWTKYPAAMLRARCISAVARFAFPDTIAGMYTPEELGAAEDADGNLTGVPVVEEIAVDAGELEKAIKRDEAAEAGYVEEKEKQVPHAAKTATVAEAIATPEITGQEAFRQAQEAVATNVLPEKPQKVERPKKAKVEKPAKVTPIRPEPALPVEPAVFTPLRQFLARKKERANAGALVPDQDVQWFIDSFDAVGVPSASEASAVLSAAFGEPFDIGLGVEMAEAYGQTIEKWIDRQTFAAEIAEAQQYVESLAKLATETGEQSNAVDEDDELL